MLFRSVVVLKIDGLPPRLLQQHKPPWIERVFGQGGTQVDNFYVRGISLSAPSWSLLDTGRPLEIHGNVEYDRYTLRPYDYLNFVPFYFSAATSGRIDMRGVELLDEIGVPLLLDRDGIPGREEVLGALHVERTDGEGPSIGETASPALKRYQYSVAGLRPSPSRSCLTVQSRLARARRPRLVATRVLKSGSAATSSTRAPPGASPSPAAKRAVSGVTVIPNQSNCTPPWPSAAGCAAAATGWAVCATSGAPTELTTESASNHDNRLRTLPAICHHPEVFTSAGLSSGGGRKACRRRLRVILGGDFEDFVKMMYRLREGCDEPHRAPTGRYVKLAPHYACCA